MLTLDSVQQIPHAYPLTYTSLHWTLRSTHCIGLHCPRPWPLPSLLPSLLPSNLPWCYLPCIEACFPPESSTHHNRLRPEPGPGDCGAGVRPLARFIGTRGKSGNCAEPSGSYFVISQGKHGPLPLLPPCNFNWDLQLLLWFECLVWCYVSWLCTAL